MGDPLKTIKKINEQIEASIVANNQEKISRRTSQVTLHLSDSRSNSCPDINDQINEISTEQVKLRQKKSSDDFEVMPDAKRRSIIASHVSESLGNQATEFKFCFFFFKNHLASISSLEYSFSFFRFLDRYFYSILSYKL